MAVSSADEPSKASASSRTRVPPQKPICRRKGFLLASVPCWLPLWDYLGQPLANDEPITIPDETLDVKADVKVDETSDGTPYEGAGRRAAVRRTTGFQLQGSIWTAWSHVRAESTTLFYSGHRRNGPPRCVKDGEFFNEGWRPDEAA